MSQFPKVLNATEDDVQKMLACHVHIGTRNLDRSMEQYIWKRREDGIYIIDLRKTWEKLMLAARIIVTIENPSDVALVSARPYGQRAVLKFAKFVGATALAGRYTPGTFTNQIQRKFVEPRVLVCNDPRTDHQPLREASYVNLATISFAHTDAQVRYVDCAIPANNKGKNAIGLMYWMLAREVLRMRGSPTCNRSVPWDVMVDLFIFRDPEEIEKEEEAKKAFGEQQLLQLAPEQFNAAAGVAGSENWNAQANPDWSGTTDAAAAAAVGNWDNSVAAEIGDWSSTN